MAQFAGPGRGGDDGVDQGAADAPLLVEALADGGVKAGLPRPLAQALAVETLAGTGALLEQTG
ncbi:MAG: pyrroline-5-carboxylate reductase dimerization domain-containing protein, partial [Planctomycetia bacterium]